MHRFITTVPLALAVFALGCDDGVTPFDKETSGLTGYTAYTAYTGDTATKDCPFKGPVLITQANVTCPLDKVETVVFTVETEGVPFDGLAYSQETANTEPQFSDEHTLDVIDEDKDCGAFATLGASIQTDLVYADGEIARADESTYFSCDDDQHYGADVMTYAFRVYDADNNLLDCIIAGENPKAVLDDKFDNLTDPSNQGELEKGCDIGVLTNAY